MYQVASNFSLRASLSLVRELEEDGKIEAAEKWLEIAKDKGEGIYGEFIKEFSKRIEYIKSHEKGRYVMKNLCRNLKTVVDEDAFLNSSVRCRMVQEGNNPFNIRKVEELSMKPEVLLVHDFLSSKEVEFLLKGSEKANWSPAPDDEDDEDEDEDVRVARSFFVMEDTDPLGDFTRVFKRR